MSSAVPPKPGTLVVQPHGGAIHYGNPGNKGGSGVPPSAIRLHLRGGFYERVGILERMADGEVMQKMRVGLTSVLPYVVCANCGEAQIAAKDPKDAAFVEIEVMVSASPKDRREAMDLMAKYGLGALREISVENVRERVAGTLDVIRENVAPELYERMLPQLRAQWA